jgi:hypothetical protein
LTFWEKGNLNALVGSGYTLLFWWSTHVCVTALTSMLAMKTRGERWFTHVVSWIAVKIYTSYIRICNSVTVQTLKLQAVIVGS